MGSLAIDFISVIVPEQIRENESQKPDACLISPWEVNAKIRIDFNEVIFSAAMSISENPSFSRISPITPGSYSDR